MKNSGKESILPELWFAGKNSSIQLSRKNIPIYAEEMHNAACHDKEMPHAVHILILFQRIEHDADGIKHAAQKKKRKAVSGQPLVDGLDTDECRPTHADIANHGKLFELFDAYRIEYDTDNRRRPNNAEQRPAECSAKRYQCNGCIRSGNQEKDGGVVKHTENFSCCTVGNGMVYG